MSLNNDFIQFKNELLKDIRDFEKRITEQITSKNITIDTDLERIHGKLEQLISSNKTTSQKLIEHQVKFDSINELETFKKKNEDYSKVFELRLNQAINDIEATRIKYDKIIGDNLVIPGIIGNNNKFKNIGEYLINNNLEISKLKSELESQKRQMNEIRKKSEQINKNILKLMESTIRQNTNLIENNREKFQKLLNENNVLYNKKISDAKNENFNQIVVLEEKINVLKNEIKAYQTLKPEIINEINKTIEEKKVMLEESIEKNKKDLINTIDNSNSNISKNSNEIIRINKKIEVIKYKMKAADQKKSSNMVNNEIIKDNSNSNDNEIKHLNDKRRLSYENLRANDSKNENEKTNQNEDIKKRRGTVASLKDIKAIIPENNLINKEKKSLSSSSSSESSLSSIEKIKNQQKERKLSIKSTKKAQSNNNIVKVKDTQKKMEEKKSSFNKLNEIKNDNNNTKINNSNINETNKNENKIEIIATEKKIEKKTNDNPIINTPKIQKDINLNIEIKSEVAVNNISKTINKNENKIKEQTIDNNNSNINNIITSFKNKTLPNKNRDELPQIKNSYEFNLNKVRYNKPLNHYSHNKNNKLLDANVNDENEFNTIKDNSINIKTEKNLHFSLGYPYLDNIIFNKTIPDYSKFYYNSYKKIINKGKENNINVIANANKNIEVKEKENSKNSTKVKINDLNLTKESKLSQSSNNFKNYQIAGKKIKQNKRDNSEDVNPAENLYKAFFNKRHKKEKENDLKNRLILSIPKKISPAFGRTSYKSFNKK